MPAELVKCPECRRTLRVPGELVGKTVKCPTCGHTFTGNPDEPAAPPPPPPPPPPVAAPPPRTSRVDRDDDDDFEEERARRRRQRDDNDDDDYDDRRPRRRRSRSRGDDDDDDYEARRPRRRDYAPHRGSTILVLGILSFFFMPIILGPMAWIMGGNDLAEIRAGRMDPEGYSSTNAGRICGMISTILFIGFIVLMIVLCAGVAATSTTNSNY